MNGVLTVIAGAVFAGLFALAGTAYSSHQEHRQWLRNARVKAYAELSRLSQEIVYDRVFRDSAPLDGNAWREKLKARAYDLAAARSEVMIVGPQVMGTMALELADATGNFMLDTSPSPDNQKVSRAQVNFALQAHLVLGTNKEPKTSRNAEAALT